MIYFLAGVIVGVFGLICVALCQVQKPKATDREEVYFALSIKLDGVKLFMNKDGAWGEFSLNDTELVKTVKELTLWPDTKIEKVAVRFVQTFK